MRAQTRYGEALSRTTMLTSLTSRPAVVPEFVICFQVMYVSTLYERPSAPVTVFVATAFVQGVVPQALTSTRWTHDTVAPAECAAEAP